MALSEPSVDDFQGRRQPPAGSEDQDAINAASVMRFIRMRYRICLAWLLAGLAFSLIYSAATPPFYTAAASVLLEDQAAKASQTAVADSEAAHSSYIETQVQVLESDEVISRVVDERHLADDPELGDAAGGLHALLSNYAHYLLGADTAARGPRYATFMRVRSGLSVQRIGVSDVVEIQFTSRDPDRSAAIVNSVITGYIDSGLALQRTEHQETTSRLRAALGELRDKAFPAKSVEDTVASDPQSDAQTNARFREQQEWTSAYQALYGNLLRQTLGDAGRDFSGANVRVITRAEPPLLPSSRLIFIVVATVLACGIGFGHAVIADLADHRIRTLDDLAKVPGAHDVGTIPKISAAEWRLEEGFPAYLQRAYITTAETVYNAASRLAIRLLDGTERRSGWVIGVVAPHEKSGVSSLAVHLARVIAESGQRTLLVDANWQKGANGQVLLASSQSRRLARGLCSTNLNGDILDILVLRATQTTSDLNASLSILSALDTMRTGYDYIILDFSASDRTPDVEAVIGAVNAVVAVAEARRTTTGCLATLLRKLPGDKLVSVVLNKS